MEIVTRAVIDCVVPGIPKPMPRMKSYFKNGKMWKYPPKGIEEYKSKVRVEVGNVINNLIPIDGHLPWEYGVKMDLVMVFPRPGNKIWKKKPMPRNIMLKRPDGDNLEKAIWDALNQFLYKDDSQIYSHSLTKYIADGIEAARTIVHIELVKEIE